jgi:hypothetical protein
MKLQPPRLRYLGKVAGLPIYLVSGRQIRDTTDIDFTCGGNEAVYPSYVPPGEIWIDDALHTHDRIATALHEIVERDQMMRHGLDYDDAHEIASAHERPFRRELSQHPSREFDAARVAAAYRRYLREPGRYPVLSRPDEPARPASQLKREIDEVLGRRRR